MQKKNDEELAILQVSHESADIQQFDSPPSHQVQQSSPVIDQVSPPKAQLEPDYIEVNEDGSLISIEVEKSPVRERESG